MFENGKSSKTAIVVKKVMPFSLIVLAALIMLPVILGSCGSPLGMGKPIDWEPPVLTLDPWPIFPRTVGLNTVLTGTVTDNIGVDRVILREAGSGRELFHASLSGNKWQIALDFDKSRNGETLAVEVVAFDAVGNSGESSIKAITLVIDIHPPIIEDVEIVRTDTRRTTPRSLNSYIDGKGNRQFGLKDLESLDAEGKDSKYVEEYQTGFFYITGQAGEDETRIDSIKLNIWDAGHYDQSEPLLSLDRDSGSYNSPKWKISEEAILDAGDLRWPGYKSNYYNNSHRYYYLLEIRAIDRGGNTSANASNVIKQDYSFFCLWERADEPKGLIDPSVGTVVQGGATIPVEFFDDDTLDYAYAGLLTQDQWNGIKPVASGFSIQAGSNEYKLEQLRNRLVNNTGAVNDWRFDKHSSAVPVVNLLAGKEADEKLYYVETGNGTSDYGDFVLFTIVGDKKLAPHTNTNPGPNWTDRPREKLHCEDVRVIDENQPLIVFDTVDITNGHPAGHLGIDSLPGASTGGSPEENTFPILSNEGDGGRYFEINGYTLRATPDKTTTPGAVENYVRTFRMAWIPYGMPGTETEKVNKVQAALKDPSLFSSLPGVQYWNFVPVNPNTGVSVGGAAGDPALITGTKQNISGKFQKQVFRKKFDILGGNRSTNIQLADYGTPSRQITLNNPPSSITNEAHFVYNDKLENETKLFVLYAEDNMGNSVFRQVRFLGNKKPPELKVYDITEEVVSLPASPQIPNLLSNTYYNAQGNIDNAGRTLYQTHLAAYQKAAGVYAALRAIAFNGNTFLLTANPNKNYLSEAYQAYPRNTLLKYWVTAEADKGGDLAIQNITMEDITYSGGSAGTGNYSSTDRSLSYIETLPEVTTRNFLFTATDSLGNRATIQRTIAITNTAVLNNITTETQSGTYGLGETITLQANFSNLIKWTGTDKPKLNVRYRRPNGNVEIHQIDTETPANVRRLSLDFSFPVADNYGGILETMYDGIGNKFGQTGTLPAGNANDKTNRPIFIPNGTRILDDERGSATGGDAFTPGNSTGFNWTEEKNSLQEKKRIELDGKRPGISGLTVIIPSGKTDYPDTYYSNYYFKKDETIEFTITADEDIQQGSPPPQLQFTVDGSGPYYAVWQRSPTPRTMVFAVRVDTQPDGLIGNYAIQNAAAITDICGNALAAGTGSFTVPALKIGAADVKVIIDKTPPTAPPTSLNNIQISATTPQSTNYNASPYLRITQTNDGSGIQPAKTEYSLDNGVAWVEFPQIRAGWTNTSDDVDALFILNGQWTLKTRFTDRAGNIGAETTKTLHVNSKFPDLKTITAVQPSGTYSTNSILQFDLSFDAVVWTQGVDNVTITLANRNTDASNIAANNAATTNGKSGISPRYEQKLTATPVIQGNAKTTIRFEWDPITGKEMLDGLYISAVDFTGLRDRFGNPGGLGTAGITGTTPNQLSITIPSIPPVTYGPNTCNNLNGAGLKVDCLGPARTGATPANAANLTGNVTSSVSTDNKTITLTFDEPVQRGRGDITVRPHGNYAIPAVIENSGYYLTVAYPTATTQSETRSSTAGSNSTYVSGMTDIYNNMTSDQDRNYLITGGTLAAPTLSSYTGLSAGPYKKMPHGLKKGAGYTGTYNDNTPAAPAAPSQEGNSSLVPDTTTKWVLDYRYGIHDAAAGSVVSNIRDALTRMGYRRQKIAVTSTANVAFSNGDRTVTITLTEPLLPGLQWGLFYPEGTFTDKAGNPALGIGYTNTTMDANSGYWFWSKGVQTPVIRVDRKSSDARSTIPPSPNTGGTQTYNPDGYPSAAGIATNIDAFDAIAYLVETETPRARIFYGTRRGSATAGDSITGGFTGRATIDNPGANMTTANSINWDGAKNQNGTTGTWIRRNLIFRNARNQTYTVQENGITISHNVRGGTAAGNNAATTPNNYYGFRSFNRDALEADLNGLAMADSTYSQTYSGTFTGYAALEASKSYVVAEARVDHANAAYTTATYTSQKGWEGAFRTVIALQRSGNNGANMLLCASNIKSGIPTIAGFPAKDGVHNQDTRYLKVFYNGPTNNRSGQYYWVSTEIVTSFYVQSYYAGATYMDGGDSHDWITAGYGDLSYGYNVAQNAGENLGN